VLPVTAPTSAVLSVIFRLYVAFGHPAWACVATLCTLHFCFPTVLTRISACPSFSRGPRAAYAHHGGAAWPRNFFFLMNPVIRDLHQRYPAIDPAHFRDILENKFKQENVMKLSTSFTPTPRRKETLTLGTYTIPTVEQDHASDDYRGGIPSLIQPFEIYGQILVQFAPPGVRPDLQIALASYRNLLYTINRTHTFESVKSFHFTFHYKRLSLGRYDPKGWLEPDPNLQMTILRQRDDSSAATTSSRNKRPFNSHHGPEGDTRRSITSGWEKNTGSQAPAVCFNFNKGQCTRGPEFLFRHICSRCNGAHPALDHNRITGGSAEPDANSAPLGPRGKRQ
jgi:hypothetical protein